MSKNSRYWAIGAIVVLALLLIWIMFSAGNPGSSGQDSIAESTASSSGASESASSAAEDTSESSDSHSGHNMDGHSASADQNLKSYLADQDRQMDQMMTGMQGIPESGSASVDFLTGMIPHHQAAVDMAESYLKYGGENKELKELAENIIEVQREEIDQMEKMAGSLKEKGTHNEDQAKAYRQEYDKMFEDGAHGHHMPDSSPATVDEAFSEGMMIHHQMAVDMARSILEYTDDEEVTQLANSIVEQQEVEISQMKGILEGLQQGQPESAAESRPAGQ